MTKRLTWKEIQKKYPDQWIGLEEVVYLNNDGVTVESAVVKYVNRNKEELTRMALDGEIDARYTTPDNVFQLGVLGG